MTPPWLISRIERSFGCSIGLDPCAADAAVRTFEPAMALTSCALEVEWPDAGLVYCNPPYSQMATWADKIALEAAERQQWVVTLCAARTETKWFRKLCWDTASAALFLYRRVKFVSPITLKEGQSGTFPSVLVFHGQLPKGCLEQLGDLGKALEL